MVEIKQNEEAFFIGVDYKHRVATLEYTIEDEVIFLNSTDVDESMRGQGIAGKLVDRAVDYARKNQLKVKPVCSYAVTRLRKEEFQDIVV